MKEFLLFEYPRLLELNLYKNGEWFSESKLYNHYHEQIIRVVDTPPILPSITCTHQYLYAT